MRADIAVFVLNLSDIIFLRTAPHKQWQWWQNVCNTTSQTFPGAIQQTWNRLISR